MSRYSREKTEAHPFATRDRSLLRKIADVLRAEGGGTEPRFRDETGFKPDDYDAKRKTANRETRSAVDLAFVLDSGRVQLAEAKFRTGAKGRGSNFERDFDGVSEKIVGSIDILGEPPTIERRCVVLVNPKYKSRAEYALNRLRDVCLRKKLAAKTETEFYDEFFADAQ